MVYIVCHTACVQDQDGTEFRSDTARKLSAKPVWHIPLLCVQWKTPDDGQRNCPKHVEFYSKTKFEKLVHLVGFIIRISHDARSHERQIRYVCACIWSLNDSWPTKYTPRRLAFYARVSDGNWTKIWCSVRNFRKFFSFDQRQPAWLSDMQVLPHARSF